MELTRAEVDRMLQHADEARTKLRRASRELKELGERIMAAREAAAPPEHRSDDDRSR